MKTKLISALVGPVVLVSAASPTEAQSIICADPTVLVSTAISAQAQFLAHGNYGCTITPAEYQTPVVYQQPVVYNGPVIYNGPVYYMNGALPQYVNAWCEPGEAPYARSSVFVMGGSGGSYGYANYGQCNPNVVIFGRRGGWFGR